MHLFQQLTLPFVDIVDCNFWDYIKGSTLIEVSQSFKIQSNVHGALSSKQQGPWLLLSVALLSSTDGLPCFSARMCSAEQEGRGWEAVKDRIWKWSMPGWHSIGCMTTPDFAQGWEIGCSWVRGWALGLSVTSLCCTPRGHLLSSFFSFPFSFIAPV